MTRGGRQRHRAGQNNRSLLISAALCAAIFTFALASGCKSEPLRKVRIGATTLPASAPVFIAEEQGYFEDEGLDAKVITFPAGRLALDSLFAEEVDIATVAQTPLVRDVLAGKDPVIVATIAEIEGANFIVARKDRGIANAQDLHGKRIGVLKDTTADYFLHIYLVTFGVDPKDVEVVSMEESELVSAVVSGDLDGASAFAPYTFRLQEELGANAVTLDEPHLYTTMWNVVVRRETIGGDSRVVRSFLRAIARADEYADKHPAESQRILAKRTGAPEADLRREWTSHDWSLELDQSLVLALEDEARWMLPGRDSVPPNFLKHIDSSALRAVHPSGVRLPPAEAH